MLLLGRSNWHHSTPFEVGFLVVSVFNGFKIWGNLIKTPRLYSYRQAVFVAMASTFYFCISDICEKVIQRRLNGPCLSCIARCSAEIFADQNSISVFSRVRLLEYGIAASAR